MVSSFRFPVFRCSKFLVRMFTSCVMALSFVSCGDESNANTQDSTAGEIPVAQDKPPFDIQLLPGYKIEKQQGSDFVVYYFQAEDTSQSDNEGGIYFGGAPDTSSPRAQAFTKREFRDVFMGDTANWREFTTATYVQREVYLELSPIEKIHAWCYANDSLKLEQLYTMIKSIR